MRGSQLSWRAGFLSMLMAMFAGLAPARAAFVNAGSVSLTSPGNHHGIAFDGSNWHIANPFTNTYHNYAANFTFLNDTSVAGVSDMRGLTYDANSNHLFVGNNGPSTVSEVTLGGTIVNQFTSAISGLNALAFDRRDNTIWLAHFNGAIEKRTRTGTLISSFTAPFNVTGLALDPVSNSLFIMESDFDSVSEYRFNGTLVGVAVAADQIPDNGQGLAYDPSIGRLYATTQGPGVVTFFDDPSRVPEPGGLALVGGAAALGLRRRRD